MKQMTIYDLLPLLKSGWVAMDDDGTWCWFSEEPYKVTKSWWPEEDTTYFILAKVFNIAPFDGDWKDSLIKVEHKCTSKCSSKCSSSGQVKEHIINIEDFSPPHPTGFMSESQLKRMFEHKEEE